MIDLRHLFLGLQSQLTAKLQTNRAVIQHPAVKGEAAELNWNGMLRNCLPSRYQLCKAFVLDCDGNLSHHIDLVIYDRQYSPLLFNQDGAIYIPAESVYAVFEVKQELSKDNVEYAGCKAESVRRLRRTTAIIPHAGGVFPPKQPFNIIAGILCLDSAWDPPMGDPLLACLNGVAEDRRLDLGCALRHGAFEVSYSEAGEASLSRSGSDVALVFLLLRLLARLQEVGTVPAIDFREYGRILE